MKSAHEIYTFDQIQVFFKHTDAYGLVHPYNFLEWMSYAREAFFQELVPNFRQVCDRKIKMVTYNLELNYHRNAVFGDHVTVEIYSEKVKRLSFNVIFNFYNARTKELLAAGMQTLTFLDGDLLKPTTIPPELKDAVSRYEKVTT